MTLYWPTIFQQTNDQPLIKKKLSPFLCNVKQTFLMWCPLPKYTTQTYYYAFLQRKRAELKVMYEHAFRSRI